MALELVPPAHLWVPPHRSTAGQDAAEFAERFGVDLEPEQRLVLDAVLAEAPNGRWAALEACVVAPRQNLKTFVFLIVALSHLYLFDAKLVTWTAHEFNTAMEAFLLVKGWLAEYPILARRVVKVIEANGDEGIEFAGGRRLKFRARTKTGGRGLTGDAIILDEAFALQPSHMGSLIPTLSAKSVDGNPQIIYGSSACLASSDVLRSIRDRGRAGNDPSLTYVEWCAPQTECRADECRHTVGSVGCALDDMGLVKLANPALDRRISRTFIGMERRSMAPGEFMRERLGWHEDPQAFDEASMEQWASALDASAVLTDPVALAVDVAPNSVWSCIAASSGGVVEIIEHRQGTAWVADRLAELRESHTPAAIGLDPSGPAGVLIDPLIKAVGEDALTLLPSTQVSLACAAFVDALAAGRLRHRADQDLDLAVAGARRKTSGDTWKWSRRDSSVNISPLVAVTIAHYLAGHDRPLVASKVSHAMYGFN